MTTISLQEAQAELATIVRRLSPGEELIITENERPVARLVAADGAFEPPARRPGTLRGTVLWMAPDFDEPVADFQEYME